jgi:hypothetical protein
MHSMLDLETSVMVIAELKQESLMCISPPCHLSLNTMVKPMTCMRA